jgi:peptidoglycan hydrolase CwlO-like protein
MKKFILALIVLLAAQVNGFSQTDYPRFATDSLGQAIVMMTVEQAQSLDNNTDLLRLFEKLDTQLGDYDEACIRVIGQKDVVIASQDIQIKTLKESLLNKDEQIVKLQKDISLNEGKITSFETELKKKNEEIELHKGEIRRVKKNAILGGGISAIGAIGLLIALILK